MKNGVREVITRSYRQGIQRRGLGCKYGAQDFSLFDLWHRLGMRLLCFTGVAGVLVSGEAFLEPVTRDFVAQALEGDCGTMLCEHGDCVYFDRLPAWLQIGIHFTVGLAGYFSVAFHLEWLPTASAGHIVASVLFGVAIFIAIWLGFISPRAGKRKSK